MTATRFRVRRVVALSEVFKNNQGPLPIDQDFEWRGGVLQISVHGDLRAHTDSEPSDLNLRVELAGKFVGELYARANVKHTTLHS